MPAPSVYTELTLKDYIHRILGAVADVLSWSVPNGSYDEIVNETLLVYGESDISEITGEDNIRKLRTLARRETWRAVIQETAASYDFQSGGGSYSRSLIHKMAMENLAKAESDASEFDPAWNVSIDTLNHLHDPYQYREPDDRTL